MIKCETIKSLYLFKEDLFFDKDNIEQTTYGFEVWINYEGIKDFIYMALNKKSCTVSMCGWERTYTYNNGILTQEYKTAKGKEKVYTAQIDEEKMKDLLQMMYDVYVRDMSVVKEKRALKNAKTSASIKAKVNNVDTSSETAPESPKEALPDIPTQKEESVVETQENDKEDVYINNQQVEEKKPINMLGRSIDEVIDIILKKNNVESIEELNKPEKAGLKYDIWIHLWNTERKYFENRYGITGPDDMFNELMKVFKPC